MTVEISSVPLKREGRVIGVFGQLSEVPGEPPPPSAAPDASPDRGASTPGAGALDRPDRGGAAAEQGDGSKPRPPAAPRPWRQLAPRGGGGLARTNAARARRAGPARLSALTGGREIDPFAPVLSLGPAWTIPPARPTTPRAPVCGDRGTGRLAARPVAGRGLETIGRGARAAREIRFFLGRSQDALSPLLRGASHVRTRPVTQ